MYKAIIDDKTWKIVSAKRSLNSAPVVHNNVVQNPLCGLVICAKYGKKMKRRSYSKYSKEPTLYCANPKCDNAGSKFHFVEEKVLDGLKNLVISMSKEIFFKSQTTTFWSKRIRPLRGHLRGEFVNFINKRTP